MIVHKAVPEPVHVYATKSHVGVLVEAKHIPHLCCRWR